MATKPPSSAPTEASPVHSAFHKILTFARDINTQLQVPEIVLIGRQGHGKSSVLEAIIGQPFNLVAKDKGACTKRPIFVNMINNPACDKPKFTLKRDPSTKDSNEDKVVALEHVEKEIALRNNVAPNPIHITCDYKHCWNITFIDTPGLIPPTDKSNSEISPDEVEEMVLDLAKPSHRILIFVEEVKDGTQSDMIMLAKKVDPRLDRSIFIFTKLSDQLKNFTSTRDLNRYLTSTASSDTQSFFVSLVPGKDKAKYASKESFKQRMEELVKEDMVVLEQLQYDRRYANAIGVAALRRYVLELTFNKYQASIPELLKKLRVMKKKSEDSLHQIQQQGNATDTNKLRGAAAKYVMQFLQCVDKLLNGTLEGNPSINGQSLNDEKSQDETGEWRDASHQPIPVKIEDWKIPHAESKLYGGQQFERLLAEFKSVTEHIGMEKLSSDDIATAAGPQKLSNSSSCTWAASDLAQRQVQKALLPLVDQLFVRASYIMKRLVTVAESMLEVSKKNRKRTNSSTSGDVLEDLDQYPFFTHAVRDLYFRFIDATAEDCKRKCKDEFFCTRLIYWELTNLDGKTLTFGKNDGKEEVRKAVVNLATDLFSKIKERISKNILLKSYNYFLVPMQSDLWSDIQGNITSLNDDHLQELFEVSGTKQRLSDAERDMKGILEKFLEQESIFSGYASEFSKLTPRELDI